jgi:hypothetical protein
LGVENGDGPVREGEGALLVGEGRCGGLIADALGVLRDGVVSAPPLSSFAVMEAYLDALEPDVIFGVRPGVLEAVGVVALDLARARNRATRAAGVSGPMDGVVRPLGVTRPFEIDGACEGLPL